MNTSYTNAVATHGASLITHIGLFNAVGVELTSGSYARKPVTWTAPANGQIRPTADLVFNVAAGDVVAEWRGFSALTGGTDYGGAAVVQRTFSNPGTYTLTAADTAISHTSS